MTNTPSNCEQKLKKNRYGMSSDNGSIVSVVSCEQKNIRDNIIRELSKKQCHLTSKAYSELAKAENGIRKVIDSNRGGTKGVHGFIAEHAQVGIGNANSIMSGHGIQYILLDNNGRDDILKNGAPIQMKFVQKALSLDAVAEHLEKYPDAVSDGVLYMIPKDYWKKLQCIAYRNVEEAGKLRSREYNLWLKLKELEEQGVGIERLCPAEFDYSSSMVGNYQNTIDDCRFNVDKEHDSVIKRIISDNAPSWQEALKDIGIGASIEGIFEGLCVIVEKHEEGIHVKEYSKTDGIDIVRAVGKGALNGGLRSGVVYLAVNYTPLPAGVASGMFTIAEKAIELGVEAKKETMSMKDKRAEIIATIIDVSVTTLFALAGAKTFKKNRVVGSMIGTIAAKAVISGSRKLRDQTKDKKCA